MIEWHTRLRNCVPNEYRVRTALTGNAIRDNQKSIKRVT